MGKLTEVPDDFDRWPDDRRRAWRLEQLKSALDWARRRSAFYRDLWDENGVNVDRIADFDEMRVLPVVTKDQIIGWARGQSESGDARVGFSTRGTSGNPLVVWLDDAETERYIVPTVRGFRWAGLRAESKALILSPSWHRLAAMEGHAVVRLGATPCYFWGTLSDPSHAAPFVDALTDVRPEFVTSTPPFLLNVLRHCEDRRLDPIEVFSSVKSVVLAGLALSPVLRRFLEYRLGVVHIFERGGSQEGAALDECRFHSGMHVHEDVCHLEVVDEAGEPVGDGARGRLVITKLVASGSPFVRYDTGDLAYFQPGKCRCGSQFRRLRILGRPESTVIVEEKPITGYEVRCVLDDDPDLVGRISLLVRDDERKDRLKVLIEGEPAGADPQGALAARLGVRDVEIDWLGGAELTWGFRQVIDARELVSWRRS